MKYFIGFLLGIVASAAAETDFGVATGLAIRPIDVTLNAGVGPDGKMAPIRVDANGHVICSEVR